MAPATSETPKPGGTYNYPLQRQPGLHRAGQRPGVRGHPGRAPGLPGPRQVRDERQGRDGRGAGHRRELGHHRFADVDVPPQEGRHVPAAGQPRGQGAGLRRRVELRHRPEEPVATCRTSSRPSRACDDGGYQVDPKKGLTGVKAIDDYTLEVKLRYPFAEFYQTLGHTVAAAWPGRLPQEDRRQGVQPEARGHRPVHGRDVEEQPVRRPRQEPDLLGHGQRRLRGHHPHADHPRGVDLVAAVPEGRHSTTRSCRRARSRSPRPTPKVKSGEWTAKACPDLGVYFVGMNMTDKLLGQSLDLRKAVMRVGRRHERHQHRERGRRHPGRPATCPWASPASAPNQNPYAYNPDDAKTIVAGLGDAPDAAVLVQHRRGPPEDRRGPAGRLAEGRHHTSAQQLRVGHVPRQALQGQPG